MGSYEIRWKKSAIGDLRRIDKKFVSRIIRAIEDLETNPYTAHSKKLKATEHIYRLRIGVYRVVYHVDTSTRTITIYHVRHRKDIYRFMKLQ
jgi:mRNA interferase RelE/StbE